MQGCVSVTSVLRHMTPVAPDDHDCTMTLLQYVLSTTAAAQ